jgi:ubiquinone/menaquinone biosynthesis C-methylase UbiE
MAARRGAASMADTVQFGLDLPTEADLRLCGELKGRRVLDIGCGAGENAVAMARQGAHVIAIDVSSAQLALGHKLADSAEVRVEWHESDAADLAFLRADSIDLALAAGVVHEIEDLDRLLRQVHRVLRAGAPFVFSHDHPMRLAVERDDSQPGGLPLGRFEVRRSYFDMSPIVTRRNEEPVQVWPRTIADVFSALHRAGYRVDVLLEPEVLRSADPGPATPTAVLWRARKEGV